MYIVHALKIRIIDMLRDKLTALYKSCSSMLTKVTYVRDSITLGYILRTLKHNPRGRHKGSGLIAAQKELDGWLLSGVCEVFIYGERVKKLKISPKSGNCVLHTILYDHTMTCW